MVNWSVNANWSFCHAHIHTHTRSHEVFSSKWIVCFSFNIDCIYLVVHLLTPISFPAFMSISSSKMQSVYVWLSYRLSKFCPTSHYLCCHYTIHSCCSVWLVCVFSLLTFYLLSINFTLFRVYFRRISHCVHMRVRPFFSVIYWPKFRLIFQTLCDFFFIDNSWGSPIFVNIVISIFLNIDQSPHHLFFFSSSLIFDSFVLFFSCYFFFLKTTFYWKCLFVYFYTFYFMCCRHDVMCFLT